MKKSLIIYLFLLILALGGGCGAAPQSGQPPSASGAENSPAASPETGAETSPAASPETEAEPPPAGRPLLRCLYFDDQLVGGGIRAAKKYEAPGELTAGMIPHHLLASDMIAGFFELASRQEEPFDRVLIVSPSHFPENCPSDVVTARADWDTPYGVLSLDEETAEALLADDVIAASDAPAAVEADHGAAGLIPFVKKYLPGARVSVCLLSNRLPPQRLEAVQKAIAALREEGRILVVASADCSHYLTPDQAVLRDEETARAIEGWDFARIFTFGDSNVDSPQAVTTFLRAAQDKGAALTRLDHASSQDMLPHALSNPVYREGITTYYVYAATLPE